MKKVLTLIITLSIFTIAVIPSTAFASSKYINSTGSEATDISILDDEEYIVAGKDTTQGKVSEYDTITSTEELQQSPVDIYATISEGSDVYDPDSPQADEDGFVDGSILVGVPTTIILSGNADSEGYYTGTAQGKVKGNIAGTTIINVVPDESVTLNQPGKDSITATIEQDFTQFAVSTSTVNGAEINKNVTPEFNDLSVFNVTVKTNEATAGSWTGSFNYTIYLSNNL